MLCKAKLASKAVRINASPVILLSSVSFVLMEMCFLCFSAFKNDKLSRHGGRDGLSGTTKPFHLPTVAML